METSLEFPQTICVWMPLWSPNTQLIVKFCTDNEISVMFLYFFSWNNSSGLWVHLFTVSWQTWSEGYGYVWTAVSASAAVLSPLKHSTDFAFPHPQLRLIEKPEMFLKEALMDGENSIGAADSTGNSLRQQEDSRGPKNPDEHNLIDTRSLRFSKCVKTHHRKLLRTLHRCGRTGCCLYLVISWKCIFFKK